MKKLYARILFPLAIYTGLTIGNFIDNKLEFANAIKKSRDSEYSLEVRKEFRDYADFLKKEIKGWEILNPFDNSYKKLFFQNKIKNKLTSSFLKNKKIIRTK